MMMLAVPAAARPPTTADFERMADVLGLGKDESWLAGEHAPCPLVGGDQLRPVRHKDGRLRFRLLFFSPGRVPGRFSQLQSNDWRATRVESYEAQASGLRRLATAP
jgi:hypothetical protein